EERDHDDRLRARGRAHAGHEHRNSDLPGLPAALPPDHDDHVRGAAGRAAAGARHRRGLRAAPAARHRHRGRAHPESAPDTLHDPRRLPLPGPLAALARRRPDRPPRAGAGRRHAMRARFVRWLLLGAALAGMSGCVVGPNYVRPAVVVPEAFKEMQGWKIARPGDDTLRGPWWDAFGDPTLNDLESRVSVSTQTLAGAEGTHRQATALVREARAAYFPAMTIGVGYTRSRPSSTLGTFSGTAVGSTGSVSTRGSSGA